MPLWISRGLAGLAGLIMTTASTLAASEPAPAGGLFTARGALFERAAPIDAAPDTSRRKNPSLFTGRRGASLFAPVIKQKPAASPAPVPVTVAAFAVPRPAKPGAPALRFATTRQQMQQLRALIRHAESRRDGYDAVQFGARIKPALPPTRMTLGQIYQWIDDTPRQPHAIGKYQFIPKTLRRLVKAQGLPLNTRFTPAVQDQLADQLLTEAGLRRFLRGDLSRHGFMNNLAKIWAGLPNSSGRSHYHGYAGNKASLSWTVFDAQMKTIFPERS
jgi:muramidase (phage lysozyme)